MRHILTIILSLLLVGLLIFLLIWWSGRNALQVYKVGFIAPLSGDMASYGEAMRNVVALAAEEINAEGGVNGKPLQIIYEDGKCTSQGGVGAMQKLVNLDKVKIVIGGFCGSESLSAAAIAESRKVLLLSPKSSGADLTGKSPYFFRNYPNDAIQGRALAEVAAKKDWKKVSFIEEQIDFPSGIYNAFTSRLLGYGGVVIREEFASSSPDLQISLSKLKAINPKALFIDAKASSVERIVKQMSEMKWKIPLIISDLATSDATAIQNNKSIFEGAITAKFDVDNENQKFEHLLSAYKSKFGVDLPYPNYGQTEYDAVYIIRDGIREVGYDGIKLAAWSRTIGDWVGASGFVTIGSDGDRAALYAPKVIRSGKLETY